MAGVVCDIGQSSVVRANVAKDCNGTDETNLSDFLTITGSAVSVSNTEATVVLSDLSPSVTLRPS
jgi:hypothetical protein